MSRKRSRVDVKCYAFTSIGRFEEDRPASSVPVPIDVALIKGGRSSVTERCARIGVYCADLNPETLAVRLRALKG